MPYSTREQVETRYGAANITQWADLDNTRDAAAIAARIDEAIADADARIDGELRIAYELPLADAEGNTPRLIARASALLAGCFLYEARGAQDLNQDTGQMIHRYAGRKQEALDTLDNLRAGILLLDHGRRPDDVRPPCVVEDPDDPCGKPSVSTYYEGNPHHSLSSTRKRFPF